MVSLPRHLLVVPIRHAACLADLDRRAGAAIMAAAQNRSQALRRSGQKVEGINLLLADGEAAGQEVSHTFTRTCCRASTETASATRFRQATAVIRRARCSRSRHVQFGGHSQRLDVCAEASRRSGTVGAPFTVAILGEQCQ
jgi:hypothetical protein